MTLLNFRSARWLVCLIAGAGITMTATARAAAPALEEIVVTAQRQPVPALATPLSIGRIDQDAIDLLGATHSSEALNRVPGVMVQRGSGQESLTAIRSPVLTGAGSCGAFLFLENGVPIRPVGFCNVNEMLEIDTEQADAIEVLRGTGSALYGSNSVHGTINVLQDAPAELPTWQLGLGVGPDDYVRGSFVATHQGDATGFGLKALYTHDGGWRDQSGFVEGKLNATLTTGAGGSIPSRFDLAATKLEQETAGFILGKNAYRDPELSEQNLNPEAYRNAQAVRITGLVQPQTSLRGRIELRPYFRTSRMDFLQHFLLGQPVERNGQDSAGVMSSFDWDLGDRVSLITGLDLEWADTFLVEDQAGPTTGGSPAANAIRPAGLHYDYSVTSNVAGGYAQLDYALTPSLHAGAGVRVEYVGYDYDNHMLAGNTDANGVPCLPAGCLYSRPADRSDTFTNAAPKISLRWDAAAGLMLYANASRGFRPPEMTELYRLQRNQSVAELDSEQVDAYEIGLKFARDGWRGELAAFDMRKDNVILRDSSGFYVSDGRTSHAGVEYALTWQALDSLAATVSGTYARHRYEFSRAIEGGETITAGNDVDTAPRELLRAALEFRPLPTVAAEAEWLVVGDYFVDAANAHRYTGHELLNLRARWEFVPRWSLTLRVNNALDRAYADRADFAFGNYRYFPGRPRSVFAELSWQAE
ncbi:MAG: TonB-dependent receptor [Gammaproteobacteria bacterium]|nr:TonB-dependent receptor [Gammaproteobacteria bacterium]MDH4312152.1 TonB-dependent receptor [Gammaproteobacteria bacterium]MDH5274393.1 TonB-dependent receptor [Gammaproteobacteria bacterium]